MSAVRPQPFGKYVLVRKLATGGMAEIFLAKQRSASVNGFERFVVIKRILPNLSENEEFVRMFLDEARLAAQLNHPNIVQIYDIGVVDEQYFIAMEYLSGRDLRRLMKKAAGRGELIPLPFTLQILHGLCEGLEYAHTKRDNAGRPLSIVHRDVSPQNVHVTLDGAIKVLDFGIAKAESQMVETRTGVVKGKYSYMSPEQASGARVDRRSDIFPLGILLFELTTGRRLFKTDNEILTVRAVMEAEIPRPSALVSGYPVELDGIVSRALERKADARYQSCREMQGEIEAFMVSRSMPLAAVRLGSYVTDLLADEPDPTREPMLPIAELRVGTTQWQRDDDLAEGEATRGTPSAARSRSGVRSAMGDVAREEVSRSSALSMVVARRPALAIGVASVLVALLTAGVVLWLVPTTPKIPHSAPVPTASPSPAKAVSPSQGPAAPDNPTFVMYGAVQVVSNPPGAHIVFDGQDVTESAPTTIAQVMVGQPHRFVAILGSYPPQTRELRLTSDGEFQTIRFDFAAEGGGQAAGSANHQQADGPGQRQEPAIVAFTIRSDPPTRISLGNRPLGTSPASGRSRPGLHVVHFTDSALGINYTTSIRIPEGQPFATTIAIPRGRLKVNVLPWANVTVDGRSWGQTPIAPRSVFAGRHTVRVDNPSLDRSETQTITVPGGGEGILRRDWR